MGLQRSRYASQVAANIEATRRTPSFEGVDFCASIYLTNFCRVTYHVPFVRSRF